MSLRLTLRSGSLAQWATAESAGTGKLRKGEIGVGWIEVGGSITEVVMRIGPHATPTAFSACPVISRSPLTATGANIRIPVLDTTGKTNSLLTLSDGQFVAVDDDPGSYAVSSSTDDGTGVVIPSDTPPAITLLEIVTGTPAVAVGDTLNVTHAQNVSATLRVQVAGTPAPTVAATVQTTTGTTTLTGTFASGTWTFPLAINAPASGIHLVTVTATSTVSPAATQSRSVNVVRAAAPPTNSIAITSLQLKNDATNAVVTTAANASGITLRADVTTTPAATSTAYQWRRGTTDISGATNQTYLLATADDDQIVSCVVTVSRNDGSTTVTASATASVNVGNVESGWTPVAPAQDSRLIYVANASQGGNDANARAVKSNRGYYLPGDAEIGPDPTNPVGPIVAYATVAEASKMFRGRTYTGDRSDGYPNYSYVEPLPATGYPDWIMLKRGGDFAAESVATAWGTQVRDVGSMIGGWVQSRGLYSYEGGGASGRSDSEPMVVTAWGSLADPRPIIRPSLTISGHHSRWVSLDCRGTGATQGTLYYVGGARQGGLFTIQSILIEDVSCDGTFGATDNGWYDVTFRRCAAKDAWSSVAHMQGIYLANRYNATAPHWNSFTFEECVFDRCGYKEDPNQPTTWTARLTSAQASGELPAGTGVQPSRTYFDRLIYANTYERLTIRGSIFSRGGGASNVQMRVNGVAERNLFIWCSSALSSGHNQSDRSFLKDALIRANVILHADALLPPGGWGGGIGAATGPGKRIVVDDNVIAHFPRGQNSDRHLGAGGIAESSTWGAAVRPDKAFIVNNAVNNDAGWTIGLGSSSSVSGLAAASVTGNEIAVISADGVFAGVEATRPTSFTVDANRYFAPRNTAYNGGTFAAWQSAGYDATSTDHATFESFKTAAGWTAPERDIVSYMQSVDPTYVVNEDVHVDDDATGPKQATRQKLWQVLTSGSPSMTESQAKLTARRYHAFITFIQRARANRKGAWDARWTAESVNNYIREGYGKPKLSGPYTASLADVSTYA